MSRSERAVFRLPGVSLIIPFLLFVCVTPLANAGASFWLALYVLPVAGLAYILLTRTVADAELIRTTGLLGGRRIAWTELDGLEFHGPRWAIAVGTSGRRLRLPMVRPRDLPRLAQVSGGRLLLGADAPPAPAGDTLPPPGTEPSGSAAPTAEHPRTDDDPGRPGSNRQGNPAVPASSESSAAVSAAAVVGMPTAAEPGETATAVVGHPAPATTAAGRPADE